MKFEGANAAAEAYSSAGVSYHGGRKAHAEQNRLTWGEDKRSGQIVDRECRTTQADGVQRDRRRSSIRQGDGQSQGLTGYNLAKRQAPRIANQLRTVCVCARYSNAEQGCHHQSMKKDRAIAKLGEGHRVQFARCSSAKEGLCSTSRHSFASPNPFSEFGPSLGVQMVVAARVLSCFPRHCVQGRRSGRELVVGYPAMMDICLYGITA